MSFLPAAITVSEVIARKPSINTLLRRHRMKFPLRVYEFFTVQRPVIAKAATGGFLAGVGNYIAQRYEISTHNEAEAKKPLNERKPEKELDVHRLASFAAFNAFWCGIPTHMFFGYLARSSMSTAKKLFATHFAFNPIVYFPSYYVMYGGLMGQSLSEIRQTAAREFYPTYKACVMMWVPLNTLQFLIVPPNFQVLYLASMNLAWSVLLSTSQGGTTDNVTEAASISSTTSAGSGAIQNKNESEEFTRANTGVRNNSSNEIVYVNFAEFPEAEKTSDNGSTTPPQQFMDTLKGAWTTAPRYYSTASCEEPVAKEIEFAWRG